MAGIMSTSKWLKFFTDAGLPENVAANYAVLFTDNRITTDMLLDLTKEYLYDMGIKVMGDVISILRYARTAYTQDAQEKIFQERVVAPLKTTPASRMLKHYSWQIPEKRKTERSDFKRKTSFDSPVKKFSRSSVETTSISSVRGKCDSSDIKATQPTFLQTLQGKRSVFHRLGENSVSSSTDLTKTKIHGHSVFQRLGGTTSSQSASSTVNDEDVISDVSESVYKLGPPLQYRGILKPSTTVSPYTRKPITFSSSTPISEHKGNLTDWIKPSLLQRKVSINAQQPLTKQAFVRKPRPTSTNSDLSLLFRRSLQEAEAQRQQDSITRLKGSNMLPVNMNTRIGSQEKTLTVHLPKSFSIPSHEPRNQRNNILLSQTMISDKNSESQRKTRIALAKKASNRIIYLKKTQASSNVFSRLGS